MPLDGGTRGAPDAVQVADRFRLWQNLAKAVERCVAAHRSGLAEPVPAPDAGHEPAPSPEPAPAARPDPAGKYADRARRHHAIVHGLLAEERGLREIVRHLGFTRLFREITTLGYDGSYPVVRTYLEQQGPARTPLPPAPPTVRDVTGWIARLPDFLTEDDRPRLKAIQERRPKLQAALLRKRVLLTAQG